MVSSKQLHFLIQRIGGWMQFKVEDLPIDSVSDFVILLQGFSERPLLSVL